MLAILVSLLRISHTNDICAVVGHTPKKFNIKPNSIISCLYAKMNINMMLKKRTQKLTHAAKCMSRTHQYDGKERRNYLLSAIFAALVC